MKLSKKNGIINKSNKNDKEGIMKKYSDIVSIVEQILKDQSFYNIFLTQRKFKGVAFETTKNKKSIFFEDTFLY